MSRTILIIDDNASVRDSLKFLFAHRGYKVSVAASGPEGIELAAREAFDAAMIDVNMPGMDGIQVCRELQQRASQSGRKFPVWIMTGARTSEVVKAGIEAGALAILSKPFDIVDLFRRLEEQFSAATRAAGGGDTRRDA
jgi:CheY-like chemotaxis protein